MVPIQLVMLVWMLSGWAIARICEDNGDTAMTTTIMMMAMGMVEVHKAKALCPRMTMRMKSRMGL